MGVKKCSKFDDYDKHKQCHDGKHAGFCDCCHRDHHRDRKHTCSCLSHYHTHCCTHDCGCYHEHKGRCCRRFLCEDDFRLRLGELQGGLNFRLRQLIDCEVTLEIEGDERLKGKLLFVGSNFVEIKVKKKAKKKKTVSDEEIDLNNERNKETVELVEDNEASEETSKLAVKVEEEIPVPKKRHRRKMSTFKCIILPIDQIKAVERKCKKRRRRRRKKK